MNTWQLQEKKWDINQYEKYETLFALSNGYIGVRGGFEEAGVEKGHDGFYLNGFYETYPLSYGETFPGYPSSSQAMVNLPNPKKLILTVDGEAPSYDRIPPEEYERTLDLRTGLLTRRLIWQSPEGKRILIESERFVSALRQNLFCLRFRATCLNGECRLGLSSGFDLTSRNLSKKEDPRIGVEFTEDPIHQLKKAEQDGRLSLSGRILHSGLAFSSTVSHHLTGSREEQAELLENNEFYGHRWELSLEAGEPVTLEKLVLFQRDQPETEGKSSGTAAPPAGYEALKKEHTAWWNRAWDSMDVTIAGDDAMQQGIRFNMFHLLQSVGKDGKTNIAAKGMTGEGYEGHYFWDTEIYMIPFFTFTHPEIARKLLEYRHSILNTAKARALDMGHTRGALFPWRTINGTECSSYYPAGTAQYHISSDIAHAVKIYWEGTGDDDFLLTRGLELLVETSRLWADMAVYDPRAGTYAIQNVTGPDEYTALVDNNFYTNRMVMDQLQFFKKIHRRFLSLPEEDSRRDLFTRNLKEWGVTEDEVLFWEDLSGKILLPYDEKREIIPQDDRFLQKPLWDLRKTPRDHFPLLMHYHPLTLYRYQVCKQPDVVLAEFLLSREFSREQKERDYDYYEKITTHDSSLSPCIYGCMASEIGRIEESYNYYVKTARTDLDDFHGNVKDGIHAANMAGSWIGLTYGFARMRHEEGRLRFDPLLPEAWGSYGFRIRFRSSVLSVQVNRDSTVYQVAEGDPLEIEHRGAILRVDRQEAVRQNRENSEKA